MNGFDASTADRRNNVLTRYVRDSTDYHPKFADWLLTHWGIYEAFEEAGMKVQARGLMAYSAFVIVNVLRWRADTQGTRFAMSNTMVPDLARLYNALHGQLFKVSTRFANKEQK